MSHSTPPSEAKFEELLQELRVALPGAQILLAFLLTVPFSSAFDQLGSTDRVLFAGAVVAATLAAILLIAPSAHHRMTWRAGAADAERRLRVANREAGLGLAALAIALVTSVYVVVDSILDEPAGGLVGAALALVLLWTWVVEPLRRRR